ncbi:superoxide dismutase soluble, putative [Ichthyophthirius multifiliis]|uniref:Superoxide dismutase soluble, putative n=1 Tax=Ichthyophthirius multifiliis TaxID=5932 RepID=G0QU71_ICHMU|nr:superoxide dismutase soluble, putative [Ichthyophthirius multifiliis]EGR31229.1 superoxide dismutase soluble, putative [Ichthyophthirius multifiliis]|eukprot:XP_004034715.1 superoxide dismutase soluble, putative [Ichthyophthirius multifiliis]
MKHKEAKNDQVQTQRNAVCILYPQDEQEVQGIFSFTQEAAQQPVKIVGSLKNLQPNQAHGVSIHEYGDFYEIGNHYNPHNKQHGSPYYSEERHLGDLGNIKADQFGFGYYTLSNNQISLFGELSILGRSLAIHKNQDDMGQGESKISLVNGNSGSVVACGIIGIASKFINLQAK